jgi:APA family basic amino acid/polyamine antiporter
MAGPDSSSIPHADGRNRDTSRPYRVLGYPWVRALFLIAMTCLVLNTLRERPAQSLLGVGIVALGVPFFLWRQEHTRVPAA